MEVKLRNISRRLREEVAAPKGAEAPLGTTGLDTRLTDGGEVVSPTHRPSTTPQQNCFPTSDTHFC
jgi:hypothetical protein